MRNHSTPIDYSTAAPEVQRLAEEVQASQQSREIQKDGETIAVITPVARKRTSRHGRRSPAAADRQAAVSPLGARKGRLEGVNTMERDEMRRRLFAPVSQEELARRQALLREILANRERRNIAPLTTADLVHQVRDEEYRSYDDRR